MILSKITKKDFDFSRKKQSFLSLGCWLFQKVKFFYIAYFLLIFLTCYFWALIPFNVRTNFNQKNPNYGYFNWIFCQQNLNPKINSQWYLQLVSTLFLCFLLGVFLLEIGSLFLKNYCINLSKNWLRKLVIYRCSQSSPEVVSFHWEKINQVIFYDVSHLSFHFINFPTEIFRDLVEIGFSIYFLFFFLSSQSLERELKTFVLWFNLIVILGFLFYILFTSTLQREKNEKKKQRSQMERQQIQSTISSLTLPDADGKQKKITIAKTFQLLDHNLSKNNSYFFQKIIFNLPIIIIPGLSVIFYFLYYRFKAVDFSDAFLVYLLSLSIQNAFWKFRTILQLIPDYYKIRLHYQELKELSNKLKQKTLS